MTSRDRLLAGRRLAPAAVGLAAAALLTLALGSAARSEDQPQYSPFNGRVTYKTFCLNCHGIEGHGDGPLAESLRVVPTDLTQLAAENGGEYPADLVRASIDGRKEVRGHGLREMPVWGDAFLWPEEESPERRAHVERKIGELVEYLRTIQLPKAE
ncbi:MAG TPA: cytochrome c [Thermoanaerobaculia bacterium]|nr:cytochrome c [Thermoanaerobaculia bacterium]